MFFLFFSGGVYIIPWQSRITKLPCQNLEDLEELMAFVEPFVVEVSNILGSSNLGWAPPQQQVFRKQRIRKRWLKLSGQRSMPWERRDENDPSGFEIKFNFSVCGIFGDFLFCWSQMSLKTWKWFLKMLRNVRKGENEWAWYNWE